MRLTKPDSSNAQRLIRVCLMLLVYAPVPLGSQAVVDQPGGSRPVGLMKPRISPLPEAQWTDEHKQRIDRFLPARDTSGQQLQDAAERPRTRRPHDDVPQLHHTGFEPAAADPRASDLRTAWLHGSDVIWRERVPFARKAGLTNEEIRKIAQGPAAGWTRSRRTCCAWPINCSGTRS